MDSAHPVRLYVRDPRTKRLKVAFDIIDESVPYVRRLLGDFVEADAGPWADLEPDLPALPGPEDDAVTLLRRHARDGEVRALLMDLGITKADWETASTSTREAVIAFVHASQLTDAAIVAALTDPDMRLRDSAVRLLGKLNQLLEKERNIFNNKGFGAFAFKASMLARAQRVVAVITECFRQAKEEAREAKKKDGKDLFRNSQWLDDKAQEVNGLILARFGVKAGALCKRSHIKELEGRTQPETVARRLAVDAFPDFSEDDLARAALRRRRRPRKQRAASSGRRRITE